ncbi:MAG: UDP-N-acetylglucosamine--N-acetylmuramyl-(pentapeptide) pyrophosphoryl-undecaprenol N-acetylglucosamine transferase [Patescibacteria group bacterium]
MKILFTGGGSGGHFYPIIAVAEEINKIIERDHLLNAQLYFVAPEPYNRALLQENGILFKKVSAGKMRRYFSLLNFLDIFKTSAGIVRAIVLLYSIFPDVIFSKGGYASFPVLFAARLFGIPVIIHESDSVPGKTNVWAGKFAQRIAVSYADAGSFFPKDKVAQTGNPVRQGMFIVQKKGAHEFLKLEEGTPIIFILGGSQGAQVINNVVLDALPQLVEKYQVIHQTGENNFKSTASTAGVILKGNRYEGRYHPFPYLNLLSMKMSAGIADLIISRAGSTIFEIAAWGIPSIIVPITDSNGDHQRSNAFAYARTGACLVIEENNLAANVLISDIDRIMGNREERERMVVGARSFARPDAAQKIAEEIVKIALKHEK